MLAFLAGVVMGGALDRFVLPLLVDAWINQLAGMGDERGDNAAYRRGPMATAGPGSGPLPRASFWALGHGRPAPVTS